MGDCIFLKKVENIKKKGGEKKGGADTPFHTMHLLQD